METARQGLGFLISAIKGSVKEQAGPPPASSGSIPWKDRMILPPFLGEMGFEIRYFLAAVEPWLRNGWRILAKRPEFYPDGTAFSDPDLFAEMRMILGQYNANSIGGAVRTDGRFVGIALKSEYKGEEYSVSAISKGADNITTLMNAAQVETRLRQAFARRYLQAPRPITPWDMDLLTTYDSRPAHQCGGALAFAPTYKPSAFTNPPYPAYPHVGVQMRRLPHAAGRDSDADLMLGAAQATADHLGLPLLVYGHPDGTVRPEGLPNTADLAGDRPLLRFELSMLSQCRLMLAPESGWCDLMCWLQIPTLLEKLGRLHEFTHNAVFRPRLALLDPACPVADQITALFAAGQCLPRPPSWDAPPDDMDWDSDWVRQQNETYVHGL